MDNIIKTKKWYKRKRLWAVVAVAAGAAIWAVFFRGGQAPSYETMLTKRADLIQEVSITGKIRPAQEVDLQFESSGRVSVINYRVGNKVNAGVVIASLENQDLQAAVTSAKADLEETMRNFNSLGDPAVYSSLRIELQNAEANLAQVKIKAEGDLATKYNTAFNVLSEGMTQIDGSSATLEYIRKTYFEGKSGDDFIKYQQTQINDKIRIVRVVFPAVDQPGSVITTDSYGQIDSALKELRSAYQSAKTVFTFLQNQMESNIYLVTSSTDRATINSEASSVASQLTDISGAIQNIVDQKITNTKNISDAEAKLATAKAAFPTSEDILQKQSALLSAQSQLRKTMIVAPFTGVIGKIDIERGQTVTSSVIAVSFISAAQYQIEANITEVDIGKVSAGNTAALTLDAFGSGTTFNARVSVIDTSATVVEGVTTYKTIFEFEGPIDPNIRPNMTANIDIQTAVKRGVIAVPQRAVISKDGTKIVRIFRGDKLAFEERVVKTGMAGKDGFIEITEGLIEGETVITFINE